MYESELNRKTESLDQVPPEVVSEFIESSKGISAVSVLAWSEHCTECAAPACYASCDLYQARPRDRKCRRFVEGMVRIDYEGGLTPYLLKIQFKQWGSLWTEANARLVSIEQSRQMERGDQWIGAVVRNLPLQHLPLPQKLRLSVLMKRYADKKKFSAKPNIAGDLPDYFLAECYNPNDEAVDLTLTMRSKVPNADPADVFQHLMQVPPGFSRHEVPVASICERLDLRQAFDVSVVPNEVEEPVTLYFGALTFVKSASPPAAAKSTAGNPAKCKCIVWDLDNTLWSGVLIEDGLDDLVLRPGIEDLLKYFDERGVLHSIASKNNQQEALEALRHFGIEDYFLCPQISWNPKSTGIREIARRLNIGTDTLLFVDDQVFEREEVAASTPEVRVLDVVHLDRLKEMVACDPEPTDEARRRRLMYREQMVREEHEEGFGTDRYEDFLRDCHIVLEIRPMEPVNLQRVHELAQRTNQLNFSGNRYSKEQLERIMVNPNLDTYVLDCHDKFGRYGTVGFGIVDRTEHRLTDLAFSCRVQNKRVEHAFLKYLLQRYRQLQPIDFLCSYRKTERNAPQGRVFDDLHFELQGEVDGVSTMRYDRHQGIGENDIVKLQVLVPELSNQ